MVETGRKRVKYRSISSYFEIDTRQRGENGTRREAGVGRREAGGGRLEAGGGRREAGGGRREAGGGRREAGGGRREVQTPLSPSNNETPNKQLTNNQPNKVHVYT